MPIGSLPFRFAPALALLAACALVGCEDAVAGRALDAAADIDASDSDLDSSVAPSDVDATGVDARAADVEATDAEGPDAEAGLVQGPEGPSCAQSLICAGVSCCQNFLVPGGEFLMGRGSDASERCPNGCTCFDSETPEHPAELTAFYLDRFEVTVGRFRAFVEQFDGTPPAPGDGENQAIPGSGWKTEYDKYLPISRDALVNSVAGNTITGTWTADAAGRENMPINNVRWYVAFAFCAWDGGRLPTEAEREMAAAGGEENRRFPWGYELPDSSRVAPGCNDTGDHYCNHDDIFQVGTFPSGGGRWGHENLADGMREWVLDGFDFAWYGSAVGGNCKDCAAPEMVNGGRSLRGASYQSSTTCSFRSAARAQAVPYLSEESIGFRCARNQ